MPLGRGIIPHDLGHLVAESHLGIADGFWGLLARGATFKRGTDRRPTRRGRALVATHRAALHAAEQIGNGHHWAWVMGRSTPVGAAFDRVAERWAEVPDDGGTLTVSWPTLQFDPATT